MSIQEATAYTLISQAEWREAKAEESDDGRSARSAGVLRRAADHVRGLPDDDPRLIQMAAIDRENPLDGLFLGETAREALRLAGFHDDQSPESVLDSLVGAMVRDAAVEPSYEVDDFEEGM